MTTPESRIAELGLTLPPDLFDIPLLAVDMHGYASVVIGVVPHPS